MNPNRSLAPEHQYKIDDRGLILPVNSMGWAKAPWKDAKSANDALTAIAASPVVMEDIFQSNNWNGLLPEEWKELRAKHYLDVEDGFYLATGVNVGYGTFLFEWQDEVLFNMRPDFGYLSLTSDCGESPINAVESAVRNRLLDYYMELDALKRAIDVGEIELPCLKTLDWWLDFWNVRGIAVPGHVGTNDKAESKPERQERLRARVQEEKAKGNKAFLATVAKEEGVSVTRIKQLLASSDTSMGMEGMWTGLSTGSKIASQKKGSAKE